MIHSKAYLKAPDLKRPEDIGNTNLSPIQQQQHAQIAMLEGIEHFLKALHDYGNRAGSRMEAGGTSSIEIHPHIEGPLWGQR